MSQDFAIGIPTLNRSDLLNPTLRRYFNNFKNTDLFIIDNGNQLIESRKNKFSITRPNKNLGVAKSWNLLCEKIFKNHDFALILNDDIELSCSEAGISFFLKSNSFDLARCYSDFNFCSFIISRECFKNDQFDESFYPAYFEDKDMLYRLKLKQKKVISHYILNPGIYRNSQTINPHGGDPSINNNFLKLSGIYKSKWGGPPGREKFKTPYNK